MKILRSLIFGFTLLFVACVNNNNEMKRLLADANILMDECPDSAYKMLYDNMDIFHMASEKQRMKYIIMLSEATNKSYIPFTTDTLLKEVASYYDCNGKPNERVKAHYLLGCAYRDMGDAASALKEYYKATDNADTLTQDCDYKLLSCVYGQMSVVFDQQFMMEKAIDACRQYSKYSLMSGDTLNWIVGMERIIPELYMKGDTVKVFEMTDSVSHLYRKYGFIEKSVSVYPTAIEAYIEQYDYQKAGELMKAFEDQSGYFDVDGNIKEGYEHYYYSVGVYNLGVGNFSLAEKAFRRLSQYGYNYESAKGLLELYRQKENKDSVLKYSRLLENALDDEENRLETEKIEKVISAHNYSHHQRIAAQNAVKVKRLEILFWLVCGIFIISFIIICFRKFLIRYFYGNTAVVLEAKPFSSQHSKECDDIHSVLTSDIVAKMRTSCDVANKTKVYAVDWKLLFDEVRRYMPSLYCVLFNNEGLSDIERKICLLVSLNFTSADITILFDFTSQSVTNFKRKANKKLFNDGSARTLQHNLHTLSGQF